MMLLLVSCSIHLQAQTTLVAGDLGLIAVNAANPDKFSVVLLKDIAAGTVINFTDNGFTGTNTTGRSGEGFLTYTAPASQTAGTVLSWANGMTIAGTGWSSAAPTNFSFNAAGDQLFAFQGSTTNWVSQSGITLLFGLNYGVALNATSSASNTLQPDASILPASAFLNLPTATYANTYFANGATSTSTVTVSGSPSAILSLIADATKWYGNAAAAATFPTYSFTVITASTPVISTSGTLSGLTTTYGTASGEASFNVSGLNISGGILLTPPAAFEVSLTSGAGFANSVNVNGSGTINSTPVFVRLKASTVPGTYSGNIILSSSGAANVSIATAASTINQKLLIITGLTANDKSYDGNTTATLSGTAILNGVLTTDSGNVSLTGTPVANFASSAVGTGIAVSVTGYSITGAAAGYYILDALTLSANITPSALQSQTITFNALANATYGDAPITLTATASSGLPVTYSSSNTNVVNISGNQMIIVGVGTANITASQSGNTSYTPAPDLIQSQLVNVKPLTVIGAVASDKTYDGTTAAIITGSALVGVVGTDLVTITNTGLFADPNAGNAIAVTSTQVLGGPDNAKYSLTLPTGLTANITQASQTITFGSLANKTTTDPPFNLIATASSGLPVSYSSSNLSVANVTGNTVTINSAGTTTITATQTGNVNYAAAADVQQTLTVVPSVNTTLAAGDIAIIGYNTSGAPDNVAILVMKDLTAGTVFYANDNEVAATGGTSFTDLNEGEASFTVNAGQTIPAGTVIVLPWGSGAIVTTAYTWSSTSGFGLGNNNEEIYIYTAPSISSVTPTTFIYFAKIGSSIGSVPSGLSLGTTAINPIGTSLRYTTTGALYIACQSSLLSAIGALPANWNTTGATSILPADWAFTVLPACGIISSTGTPASLTTSYGTASTETSFTVSGSNLAAGVSITPPAGYEVSLSSGGSFSNSIVAGAAGTFSAVPVYLRLAASTPVGTYTGNIVLSSLGAASVNIPAVSSVVSPKTLTITGLTANNKTFDGNNAATLSGTPVLNGVIQADSLNVTLGGTPVATFATATVGTAIPVTVTGFIISGSAAGNYTLQQPAGLTANIDPTTLLNQSITFNPLSPLTYGDAPFSLSANASSGLPVSFSSSDTNVAVVSGNLLTITGAGTVTITASQAGNATYNPAVDELRSLVVLPKSLTITGAIASDKVYDSTNTATITGSVLVGIVGNDIVTVNDSGVFATANAGTGIAVTSTQTLGGIDAANYSLVLPTGLSANIIQASQSIAFGALPAKSTIDPPFSLTATSSSGLPVLYSSSDTLVATISGNTVTIVGPGTTYITATQAGDMNYLAATPVIQPLNVNNALMPGDMAVIGYNTSGIPDNIALLVLTDLQEGTVFYVSDNEVTTAGGTSFADLSEGEASFVVNPGQTIPAGTVLVLPWGTTSVATSSYTWSTTSGFGLGNNNEEVYIYTAPSITSLTPTNFIYFAKIGSSPSATPAGLVQGTTAITTSGSALRYATTGATYVACVPQLLAAIGNTTTNWNTSGATTITDLDWAFTVLPACPTISFAGNPAIPTTIYGTASAESSFTVSGNNLSAGVTVTAPAGFELSLSSGGTFTSSVTAGFAGSFSGITVFVRFSASAIPGSYNSNIELSSLGVNPVNVAVTGTVNPKPLSISGITANDKIFDGNTTATISGLPVLNGVEPQDTGNVFLSGTVIANFASASVGAAIPVTVTGYYLSGSASAYYTLQQPALFANINPSSLLNQTITFNPLSSATYGTSAVTLTASASSGLPVSYTSSNPAVATVSGNVISIWSAGLSTITASQAGDATYAPAVNVTQVLNVNQKTLTVNAAVADNKIFDGTTNATISGSTLVGIIGSDTVAITTTGFFATPDAGTGIAVTSTQSLSGPQAANYALTLPTGLMADISQAAQSITFAALPNKTTASAPFALIATSSSSGVNPITYTSSDTTVATISGNIVTIVGPGVTNITASQSGSQNYSAALDVTQSLTVIAVPYITDLIVPKYMQGVNGTNANRIPSAYLLKLNNLLPNATYRYINQVVLSTEADTLNGAGNCIFPSAAGFVSTSSPSFTTTYGTFVTDSAGTYTGWFVTEPTGNATRFLPGTYIRYRVRLNNGAGGTTAVTWMTTPDSVKVINAVSGAGPNNGTGLRALSLGTPKNFVALYDDEAGNGRPLSVSFIESDGNASIANYIPFYATSVNAVNGAYAVIIPNNNPNGVRRIEQRSLATGALVGCAVTDADGIWPSGANTVNPTGGATPVVFTATDDDFTNCCVPALVNSQPLATQNICTGGTPATLSVGAIGTGLSYQWYSNTINAYTGANSLSPNGIGDQYTPSTGTNGTTYYYCVVTGTCGSDTSDISELTVAACNTTLNLVAFIQGYWDGSSAMNPTLLNQGQNNPSTDCDSILVELHSASTPANIESSVVTILHTDGTATCVFPAIPPAYYYIVLKHRNSIETWSADSIDFISGNVSYNFSSTASQAYGANQVELMTANIPNGIFALYSGDFVKDGSESIDLLDLNQLETEINNFSFGLYAEDLNGDGNVDILDTPLLENNISAFIFSNHP